MLAVFLFSVLSACTVVGAEVGEGARERSSSAEKAAEGDVGDARESLNTAIRNLRGPAIDFRYTMTKVDLDLLVTSGTYYTDPERWAATSRVTEWGPDGRTTNTMYTTAIDETLFVSLGGWRGAEKGCWVALKRGFAPYDMDAMRPDQPAYISILDQLRPAPWAKPTSTGLMSARLPFPETLALLPDWAEKRIGLKKLPSVEDLYANVVVEIADSRLLSVTVTRSSLVSPLEEAGQLTRDAGGSLSVTTLKVTYPLHAVQHAAERPSDQLLMTREDLAGGEGCHASRSV